MRNFPFTLTPLTQTTQRGALGLDAGGTQTRWALADADGRIAAEGAVDGMTGLQLTQDEGRRSMTSALGQAAAAARASGEFDTAYAGLTGFDGDALQPLRETFASALGITQPGVQAVSDIELACRAAFPPGGGYVVYAGTGSVAAFVDAEGAMHRAGGRGGLIDDGGSGYWIAREALRHVWRAEDEQPGTWRHSPMAEAVFAHIGGDDWARTRQWMYTSARGVIGELAVAVGKSAQADAVAASLLDAAGIELARLALAMHRRFGPRPVMLAGRVFDLHPRIERALRDALQHVTADIQCRPLQPHHAAARLALGRSPT